MDGAVKPVRNVDFFSMSCCRCFFSSSIANFYIQFFPVQHCNVPIPIKHITKTHTLRETEKRAFFFSRSTLHVHRVMYCLKRFYLTNSLTNRLFIDDGGNVREKVFFFLKKRKKVKWIKKASTKSTSNNIWTDFLSYIFFPPHCIPNCISPHIL